jgi:hypothetical protein
MTQRAGLTRSAGRCAVPAASGLAGPCRVVVWSSICRGVVWDVEVDFAKVGLGIQSIRVICFGLFGFLKFRVLKNENQNFQKCLGTEPE